MYEMTHAALASEAEVSAQHDQQQQMACCKSIAVTSFGSLINDCEQANCNKSIDLDMTSADMIYCRCSDAGEEQQQH